MLTLITTQHTQTHYTTGSASAEARDDIDATDCLLAATRLWRGVARRSWCAAFSLALLYSTPLHLFALSSTAPATHGLTTGQNGEVRSYNINKQKLVIIVVNSNGTKHSFCTWTLPHSPAETQQRQQRYCFTLTTYCFDEQNGEVRSYNSRLNLVIPVVNSNGKLKTLTALALFYCFNEQNGEDLL